MWVQMAFMLMERNSGNSTIDYPLDGSKGIVDALVRGIEKNGGRVVLRAKVEDILVEGEIHSRSQFVSQPVCDWHKFDHLSGLQLALRICMTVHHICCEQKVPV